jgi:hypothetical protein
MPYLHRSRTVRSLRDLAKTIHLPLEHWPGNCYAVCCELVRWGGIDGAPVYGTYSGRIAPTSIFAGRSCAHHGWIVYEGIIMDPTRWAFDMVPPQMYVSVVGDDEYDAGSNRFRQGMRGPAPRYAVGEPQLRILKWNVSTYARVTTLLSDASVDRRRCLTEAQGVWLANLTLEELGEHALVLFRWLEAVGQGGWIPIDNRRAVLTPWTPSAVTVPQEPRRKLLDGTRGAWD